MSWWASFHLKEGDASKVSKQSLCQSSEQVSIGLDIVASVPWGVARVPPDTMDEWTQKGLKLRIQSIHMILRELPRRDENKGVVA